MRYVFSPERLHEISAGVVGMPLEAMFDELTSRLADAYPGHIDTGPRTWMFNNAGGAMGQMFLLYASLREYILVFGTPIGTSGHSGRYRTEVYDAVLAGEMWCFVEGTLERNVYRPGDMAYLGPGLAKGYRIPESAWMLEYSRGFIPSMLPFGLADTVFSTLDSRTALRTLRAYGSRVVRGWVRSPRSARQG